MPEMAIADTSALIALEKINLLDSQLSKISMEYSTWVCSRVSACPVKFCVADPQPRDLTGACPVKFVEHLSGVAK